MRHETVDRQVGPLKCYALEKNFWLPIVADSTRERCSVRPSLTYKTNCLEVRERSESFCLCSVSNSCPHAVKASLLMTGLHMKACRMWISMYVDRVSALYSRWKTILKGKHFLWKHCWNISWCWNKSPFYSTRNADMGLNEVNLSASWLNIANLRIAREKKKEKEERFVWLSCASSASVYPLFFFNCPSVRPNAHAPLEVLIISASPVCPISFLSKTSGKFNVKHVFRFDDHRVSLSFGC